MLISYFLLPVVEMRVQTFFSLLSSVALTFSSPLENFPITARQGAAAKSASTVTEIWNFPVGTWVENLTVRSNGQILCTLLNTPEVYQVDPTLKTPATLVYKFSDYLGCLGITELGNDIFYLVVGNLSLATISTTPGSYSIWKLDMNGYKPGRNPPSVSKVADFLESQFFNGITSFNDHILIADSDAGALFTLNVITGATDEAILDPLMAPTPTGEVAGINGVKTRNGDLFFTNTDQTLFAEESINAQGDSTARAMTVTSGLTAADDFQFDLLGNQFFAGNDELRFRSVDGGAVRVLSNSGLLNGSTAVEFGRLKSDSNSAYVSTNGGATQFETHTFTQPGRIVRVDVGRAEY